MTKKTPVKRLPSRQQRFNELRWWLVGATALALTVWQVAAKSANERQTVAGEPVISTFELQRDQLPEDWSVNYNTNSLLGLSQTKSDGCFVDISRRDRESANPENSEALKREIVRDNREGIEDNGYNHTDLGAGQMTVSTSNSDVSLPTYEYESVWVDGETYARQSLAIIVGQGYYITINLSCSDKNLVPAQTGLSAVEFGV
jgi:hypothetical protein